MKVSVIGDGSFGKFLTVEFIKTEGWVYSPTKETDLFILAVPYAAYPEAAKNLIEEFGAGIHLVNVCSVQEETNKLLSNMINPYIGGCVTGIHPLFGQRSSKDISDRVSIVTLRYSSKSDDAIKLFSKISMVRNDGMTGAMHDQYMAKTHLQVVRISEQIQEIVNNAKDVPDYMLTPSFKKMKEVANQFLDMTPGTKASILSNKY